MSSSAACDIPSLWTLLSFYDWKKRTLFSRLETRPFVTRLLNFLLVPEASVHLAASKLRSSRVIVSEVWLMFLIVLSHLYLSYNLVVCLSISAALCCSRFSLDLETLYRHDSRWFAADIARRHALAHHASLIWLK